MSQASSALTDDWVESHLVLQQDCMVDGIRSILVKYVPADILSELKDKFAIVCRPLHSGATVIRSELLFGLHIIVLSIHLIPKSDPPLNFPREYIALTLLHELAHLHLGHHPPSSVDMEKEADATALSWFNRTQNCSMTMQDFKDLKWENDVFWLGDRDPCQGVQCE